MLDELAKEKDLTLAESDGLLLVVFTKSGEVQPHVLRLGMMSEGRLEGAMMPIFMELMTARQRQAQADARAERNALIGSNS
jgi:hypothetical protein